MKKDLLRIIAIFEAVKGVAVLVASVGVISLLHRDLHRIALELLVHFDFNPGAHYPALLLHYAEVINRADIRAIVVLALGYFGLRASEAYGLWNDLAWAEWLGALSGLIYVPFEIGHLMHRVSVLGFFLLLANVLVIAFLLVRLRQRAQHRPLR